MLDDVREAQKLLTSRALCPGELEKAGIPYTPAVGAIFMWVDLRAALAKPTWEVKAPPEHPPRCTGDAKALPCLHETSS